MSSAYFLKTPTLIQEWIAERKERGSSTSTRQEELWSGKIYRDLGPAMADFIVATQDEEWAELKWSS